MNVRLSYYYKTYSLAPEYRGYTLRYRRRNDSNYSKASMSIDIAPKKDKYGIYPDGARRAIIGFSSDQEALNFAHSIISMIHLKQEELEFEV